MKKIRAKRLSSGSILVSVTTTMTTPKRHDYSLTDHFEISPAAAHVLLDDLSAIFERKPSRLRTLIGKMF